MIVVNPSKLVVRQRKTMNYNFYLVKVRKNLLIINKFLLEKISEEF